VIKCFHEAKSFIAVDDSKIAMTLNWLLNRQSSNGSFSEPLGARAITSSMQVTTAKSSLLMGLELRDTQIEMNVDVSLPSLCVVLW
jgi:hypothetical protein